MVGHYRKMSGNPSACNSGRDFGNLIKRIKAHVKLTWRWQGLHKHVQLGKSALSYWRFATNRGTRGIGRRCPYRRMRANFPEVPGVSMFPQSNFTWRVSNIFVRISHRVFNYSQNDRRLRLEVTFFVFSSVTFLENFTDTCTDEMFKRHFTRHSTTPRILVSLHSKTQTTSFREEPMGKGSSFFFSSLRNGQNCLWRGLQSANERSWRCTSSSSEASEESNECLHMQPFWTCFLTWWIIFISSSSQRETFLLSI